MKFIFTCGGTAGHIYPAVAVAGKLAEMNPGSEFLFIGANGKMEMELVPREGYEIKGIQITNLSRAKNLSGLRHNLDTVKNVIRSTKEAERIIRDFAPDAVIGTGGYVCYPVLSAAAGLGIPSLVHESNAVPGLTTKLLSEKVDQILVGFEESRKHYRHPERVKVTGTPVRGAFDSYSRESARKELGFSDDENLVLSVWGSLGSGHMNEIIPRMIAEMDDSEFHLVHATGAGYYKKVQEGFEAGRIDPKEHNAEVSEYIYDMPRQMAAADLILCRSGASTLAELTYLGKPAVLIPSPNVTNNHQEKNARVLEQAGGAVVMTEGNFDAASLHALISALLADKEHLSEMSHSMHNTAVNDAAAVIAETVMELCGSKSN